MNSCRSFVLMVPVVAMVMTIAACPTFAQSGAANELCDSYLFTSNNESLTTENNTRILGQQGAFVEVRDDGSINVLSGTVTITTSSSSVTTRARTYEISVPSSSQVSIRNSDSVAVSVNRDAGGSVSITDGASKTTLKTGETYPSGMEPINPIVAHGSKSPLFLVGNGALEIEPSSAGNFSMSSGLLLFGPSRDIKIQTPVGMVSAGAQSRFVISVTPDRTRVFNCRSGEVKFRTAIHYRRVKACEEFCVFDHRPTKEEVLPEDGIGRKEITLHELDKGTKIASTNQFSVVTLLTSPQYLGEWKHSSQWDERLVTGIIKSAAAHAGLNPGGEAFYQTPTAGAPRAGL